MTPNNTDLNPADYSIWKICHKDCINIKGLEKWWIQHLKDLLEEKREELPQYESDACIKWFRYRLLKVIEVAGKHILNIFLD